MAAWLVGFTLAAGLVAAEPIVRYDFETGVQGFVAGEGRGTIAHETGSAVVGKGSLKIVLADTERTFRVLSPAFAVHPDRVYRVRLRQRLDPGTRLEMGLRLHVGKDWHPVNATRVGDAVLVATLPGTTEARLELVTMVQGKAVGRRLLVDAITLAEHAAVRREAGMNLYWDGSFEVGTSLPPSGWSFWATQPRKVAYRTERPHHGRRYLRVDGTSTYVVFPYVPVEPRRVYRLTYWVRGEATIYPAMHKLAAGDGSRNLTRVRRVGYASGVPDTVRLKPDKWQAVELLAVSEDPTVVWFQPLFPLNGKYVEIDAVDIRSVGPR